MVAFVARVGVGRSSCWEVFDLLDLIDDDSLGRERGEDCLMQMEKRY
jgi:hypothetical protein